MFVCCECGEIFFEPIRWKEDRGECFGFSSYEELSGSPCCYGEYTTAYECDCCGEIIQSNYVKIGDKRYCDNCFLNYELGEED